MRILTNKLPFINEFIRVKRRKQRAKNYYHQNYKIINTWAKKKTEFSNYYYDLDEKNQSDLASLISFVTQSPIEQVESYFKELKYDKQLEKHILNFWKNDSNMVDAKAAYGRRIGWYAFIRILKPKVVLETGVHHGVGGCIIASALLKNLAEGYNGKYFGTEINSNVGKLFSEPYAKVGKIIYGDSIESIKNLNETINIFINDSDHSSIYELNEYKAALPILDKCALILGDNSHVTDSLKEFSRIHNRNYIFFKEIPKDHWYPGAGIGVSFTNFRN